MTWRTAKCIDVLRAEIDAAHPGRPTAADGTIGDARHQAEKSDHNPNRAGVVTAWDITTAPFTIALAEQLRTLGRLGDKRVKYVIYRGRICSGQDGWAWRPYSGFSQHFDHIHLSVSADPQQYDRTDPWLSKIPTGGGKSAPAGPAIPQPREDDDVTKDEVREVVQEELAKLYGSAGKDEDGTHVSMADLNRKLDAIIGRLK